MLKGMLDINGCQEAVEFFNSLDNLIIENETENDEYTCYTNSEAQQRIEKRLAKYEDEETEILNYVREYNLDNRTADELRQTKAVLDAVENLSLDNPLELYLYNRAMATLDY